MQIENCTLEDIDEIYRLYDMATAYQQTKNVVVWPHFERAMVETGIAEKRQWKLMIGGVVACVWTITFNDPEIWEQRDIDAAVYIHRIATNHDFRGHKFVQTIVNWAKSYAKTMNKDYVRLDTLGYNEGLIKHYSAMGFEFLGMFRLTNTASLPLHYQRQPDCCLFEIKLD